MIRYLIDDNAKRTTRTGPERQCKKIVINRMTKNIGSIKDGMASVGDYLQKPDIHFCS